MPPGIVIQSLEGAKPENIIELETGTITIGREPENHVVIDSSSVSRRHACVFEAGSVWLLQDMDSTNGTSVNGVRIPTGQARILRVGDTVQLAELPLKIAGEQPSGGEIPTVVVFYDGIFEGEFLLDAEGSAFSIGGGDAQFGLPDGVIGQVSVTERGGRLELSQQGSDIQVFCNGTAALGATSLQDRDEISVDAYTIYVSDLRWPLGSSFVPDPHGERAHVSTGVLKGRIEGPGAWSDLAQDSKAHAGRRFVFGSAPDDGDHGERERGDGGQAYNSPAHQTVGVGRALPQGAGGGRGFEMGVNRYSQALQAVQDKRPRNDNEPMLALLGVLVFCLLVALGGYVAFIFV